MLNARERLEQITGMREFPQFYLLDKVIAYPKIDNALDLIDQANHPFWGIMVSRFYTMDDHLRYVVESDRSSKGTLRIFCEEQLELR